MQLETTLGSENSQGPMHDDGGQHSCWGTCKAWSEVGSDRKAVARTVCHSCGVLLYGGCVRCCTAVLRFIFEKVERKGCPRSSDGTFNKMKSLSPDLWEELAAFVSYSPEKAAALVVRSSLKLFYSTWNRYARRDKTPNVCVFALKWAGGRSTCGVG